MNSSFRFSFTFVKVEGGRMRIFIVLSSVFAVGLCVGGFTQQDPSDQSWCDALTRLAIHVSTFQSFSNGCPQITKVYTQVVAGMNYRITYNDGDKTCVLKFYEQSWTNTYKVDGYICSRPALVNNEHSMPGGDFQQDPQEARFTDLLFNFTQKGLLDQDAMNGIIITKVATQVVAGINYKYTIEKGSQTCHLTLFEQSWTNTYQVTTDSCKLATSAKRQLGGLAGGYTKQDPTEQMYTDLLTGFSNDGLLGQDYSACKIASVESQVVSGMNYRYMLNCPDGRVCHLQLYEQSWTNTRTVSGEHCSHNVRQLGGGLLGGWQPVHDTSDKGFQECVKATVDGINARSNNMFRLVESNVHGKFQVVAGVKYNITLSAMESSCMNSGDSMGLLSADCPANTNSMMKPTMWHSTCVYQAWQDPSQQVNLTNLEMPMTEEGPAVGASPAISSGPAPHVSSLLILLPVAVSLCC